VREREREREKRVCMFRNEINAVRRFHTTHERTHCVQRKHLSPSSCPPSPSPSPPGDPPQAEQHVLRLLEQPSGPLHIQQLAEVSLVLLLHFLHTALRRLARGPQVSASSTTDFKCVCSLPQTWQWPVAPAPLWCLSPRVASKVVARLSKNKIFFSR